MFKVVLCGSLSVRCWFWFVVQNVWTSAVCLVSRLMFVQVTLVLRLCGLSLARLENKTSPQSVWQFFRVRLKEFQNWLDLPMFWSHPCLSVVFITRAVVHSTMQHNNTGHHQSEDSDPLAASGSGLCGTVRFHVADGPVWFELTLWKPALCLQPQSWSVCGSHFHSISRDCSLHWPYIATLCFNLI